MTAGIAVSAAMLDALRARIESWIEGGEIAGAAVAVACRGEKVWESYSGAARPGVESGPSVLWPLASISKLYTAAMIMALVERGEVTLGMTVQSTIPEFTGGARKRLRSVTC